MKSKIQIFDYYMFNLINKRIQLKILDIVMPRITHLGGATITLTILIGLIIFTNDKGQTIYFSSVQALISLVVSHIIVQILKIAYKRERPFDRYTNIRVFTNKLKDYSFPSGHTTSSFAISTMFTLHIMSLGYILIPLAVIIGISRIYQGFHYPSDVVAGSLIGLLTSVAIFAMA